MTDPAEIALLGNIYDCLRVVYILLSLIFGTLLFFCMRLK